jgi:hypothetical protein
LVLELQNDGMSTTTRKTMTKMPMANSQNMFTVKPLEDGKADAALEMGDGSRPRGALTGCQSSKTHGAR